MAIYIISDVHLSPQRMVSFQIFQSFLQKIQKQRPCELFILGDFFDYWVGDDVADSFQKEVIHLLCDAAESGVRISFMRGNRDFLIGQKFACHAGVRLIDDPYDQKWYGRNFRMMHGDLLCTNDHSYLWFRKLVRNRFIQWLYLKLPRRFRERIAESIRKKSIAKQKHIPISVDVTEEGVQHYCDQNTLLIHGHTHRLGMHSHSNGIRRFVLSDWFDTGSYLVITRDNLSLYAYPSDKMMQTYHLE
jgi:UDP-2,3-diacylglucosamine hydrolase